MRVLVVEDEAPLRMQLKLALERAGFIVEVAADGEEGWAYARAHPLDVVVVDLGLPRLDGISLVERLRAAGCVYPVLILTARDRWQDKVAGLDSGADDYLTKPFDVPELVARLRALIRRAGGWASPVLACGPVRLDTRSAAVTLHDEPVDLTGHEYAVLEYLMLHQGEVVSKTALVEHLYADDASRDSNVIEVFVRRLRAKLDADGALQPIETLRGRGYRLALERDPGGG